MQTPPQSTRAAPRAGTCQSRAVNPLAMVAFTAGSARARAWHGRLLGHAQPGAAGTLQGRAADILAAECHCLTATVLAADCLAAAALAAATLAAATLAAAILAAA
eukprot:1711225-Prymnesium_polylepis.1